MSCEYDDDDIWDEPVIDVITENKIIELDIATISKEELSQIKEMAIYTSNQKLQKLNIVLKNMNVYLHNNTLLINDRYNICHELMSISKAFGLDIKAVNCGLKGKTYILADKLTTLIKTIDSDYRYGECVKNSELSEELQEIIESNQFEHNIDTILSEYLHQICKNGKLSIKGSQKVTTTYEDGRLINQEYDKIVSNKDQVTKQLTNFLTETSAILASANDNLRDGTSGLLYSRARQMGYSVEENRIGDKVELVLVRYE